MVQVHDGGGSGRPDLPAQAGPNERTLYELYDFQTAIVAYTASQWKTTASEVTELSASVRRVVRELRNAPDGGEAWSGDAANAAYDSLGRLAANLDTHAEEIARIESGLTLAGDAVVDARTAYVTGVRSISLDVDEQDFMRTPFMQRTGPVAADLPATLDQRAYDAAVADAKAQREAEALKVLRSFDGSMTEATKKLPVDPDDDPVSGGGTPGGGGTGGTGGGGSTPSGGGYVPPGGGGGPRGPGPGFVPFPPTDGGPDGPRPEPDPEPTDPDPDVPRPGTGATPCSTAPAPERPAPVVARCPRCPAPRAPRGCRQAAARPPGERRSAWAACSPGAGPRRSWAARGPRGPGPPDDPASSLPPAARRPPVGRVARPVPAARAPAPRLQGAPPCSPGGGQGPAGRASAARGGGGAARAGRYGVPRLGERSGTGVVGAAAGAGGRGSRTGPEDRTDQDVERLTTEDEETWFEGAEDATPPVWE